MSITFTSGALLKDQKFATDYSPLPISPVQCGTKKSRKGKKEKKNVFSTCLFRSSDLRVMSPALFL